MTDEMIIRATHDSEHRFFLVRRATAQDSRLTSRARGVLMFLLSKPDGWEANAAALTKEFPDLGRDSAYATINELIQHGYAARRQERDDATGKLGRFITDIYEMPVTEFQDTASPLPALPDTASPDTALPDTAKPEHIDKQNTKRNRAAEKTEQQQQTAAAAAAAASIEPHHSRFDRTQIEAYVLATKPHATNPGGLARALWRSGEEDQAIERWQKQQQQSVTTPISETDERADVRRKLAGFEAADTLGSFAQTIAEMASVARRKPANQRTIWEQEVISKADQFQKEKAA